jgi:hypothetical protein
VVEVVAPTTTVFAKVDVTFAVGGNAVSRVSWWGYSLEANVCG